MTSTLTFRGAGRTLQLCRGASLHAPPSSLLSPSLMWQPLGAHGGTDVGRLLTELVSQGSGAFRLRALLDEEDDLPLSHMSDQQVVMAAVALVRSGRLMLLEQVLTPEARARRGISKLPEAKYTAGEAPAQTPSMLTGRVEEPPAPSPVTHWVEIELLGEDDKGIPREPYLLRLPDGQEVNGFLDDKGLARIDGIRVPGRCDVCFPARDQDAWHRL